MQAFLFVAGGETYQMIRGTPLRLAQTYILVNTRGWSPWCPSIQSSVPLGVGGSFPKIASQRAFVARGGLCEFGARSNWPPGMSALIVFPNFSLLPFWKFPFKYEIKWINFSLLFLPPWNRTRWEVRGGAESHRGPRGGASGNEGCSKVLLLVSQHLFFLCTYSSFLQFMTSWSYVNNIVVSCPPYSFVQDLCL